MQPSLETQLIKHQSRLRKITNQFFQSQNDNYDPDNYEEIKEYVQREIQKYMAFCKAHEDEINKDVNLKKRTEHFNSNYSQNY